MNHSSITWEKRNVGIGLKSFIMCLVGVFCCFLQNCTALQFLKSSRLLLLEPTEGWAVQWRKDLHALQNFLPVIVNTGLILGNVWLKGYTWLNVSIFQRTLKKGPLWEGKKWLIKCFSWSHLKFRNKLEKYYLDLPGQKTHQNYNSHSENSFKFFFGKSLHIQSRWGQLTIPDITAWTDKLLLYVVNTSSVSVHSESVHTPNRCFLQPF